MKAIRGACFFLLGLLFWNPASPAATLTVCDEAGLRAAIAADRTVRFGCDATIVLTSPLVITNSVVLDGTGQHVALSGGSAVRVFLVKPGGTLTLTNLTVRDGMSTNGGAIYNAQGAFIAVGCVFTNNQAIGPFGSSGEGGAIWTDGKATLLECSFLDNRAIGGGGVSVGPLIAPPGAGGAIYNHASLAIVRCTFAGNLARGGIGSRGLGIDTTGGEGRGGALYNEHIATVLGSTLLNNTAEGGHGATTQSPGNGGNGLGGGIYNTRIIEITNCTWHSNQARGGVRGAFHLRNGEGLGGGFVQAAGTDATLAFCTLASNTSTSGGVTIHSLNNTSVRLSHSILARGPQGTNVSGVVVDLGHNISSDASVTWTDPSSLSNTDPLLGQLADNGGPTRTIGLKLGSPAIDATADSTTPSTDQRGVPRPVGARADIGAFEGTLAPLVVTLQFAPDMTTVASTVELEIGVSNPNSISFHGITLTNSLSSTLSVAAGPIANTGFNGTVIAQPGGRLIVLSGFDLAPEANCTVRVPVTAEVVGIGVASASSIRSESLGDQVLNVTAMVNVLGPPLARTDEAIDLGFAGATLHGAVNPAGLDTHVWFEYGIGANLDQQTPLQMLGAGLNEVQASAILTGLPAAMDFSVRIAASNEFGIVHGNTLTFFTLGAVTVCDDAQLRANVAQGGIVHITCDGVIVLSNILNISLDTEIDATGYQVVISGNDLVPIFSVPSGVSLTLRNLTIAHGRSTAGAGIFNRGRLLLDHCSLMDNQAIGYPGARGGNGANAPPRPPAPPRDGSPGGSGGGGGSGTGGGLFNFGDCLAIWSTFANNRAIGGVGGRGGDAGFPNFALGNPVSGGSGGPGGLGLGGGIVNYGQLVLSNCCLHGNRAVGGKGGNDGFGFPNFDESFVGYGGPGGVGFGAAIHNEGTLAIINTTLANNDVAGGEGGGQEGLGGDAFGGGLSSIGQAAMTNCTIASNQALGGLRPPNAITPRPPQGVGSGAGLAISNAAVTLKNTLLDNNQPGSNCLGPIIDAGNNLSSDGSCPFTSTGSQTNVALHLAALADNGGPTLTMALSPFSPAIDAADASACPPTDQRGLPRPALAGYDIGAYEVQPDSFGLRVIEPVGSQEVRLLGFGPPGGSFRVQRTPDFVDWSDAGMGTVPANGLFEIVLPMSPDADQFLRLVSP